MSPRKQEGGSELAEAIQQQGETIKNIYELLQGRMGEKGMVHKLNDVHDTIKIHNTDIQTAKIERAEISKRVDEVQKKQFKLAAIMSAIGLGGGMGGSKIVEKLAAFFGSGGSGH